jgi:deazaflavin-dependent oxidoreductase (nitroreductase family)
VSRGLAGRDLLSLPMLPHVDPEAQRSVLYRVYARVVAARPMGWFSRRVVWKLDPVLLRLSRGRIGFGLLLPTALLETTGARSGRPRANGVIYFHDAARVTIIASKLGLPSHPAWFHNLRAHPEVRLGGQLFHAQIIEDPAERERLWKLADQVFPPYATYRARAAQAGREIPIIQLIAR